ncbi:MAG: hypothetical protein AAB517_02000 [Patescibacteria group bacterium]
MPKTLTQFVKDSNVAEELQRQKIETRTVVATCQVDNHLIYANSLDGEDYEMLNDKPICFEHFYDYYEKLGDLVEKHPIGRGTPHGGCHGID